MAKTFRAPGDLCDLIIAVDEVDERQIGAAVWLIVVGGKARGIVPGRLW
ncbi:hypothetical protein ACVDG8_003815 [Mesorhizobium sp. ORM8.1]